MPVWWISFFPLLIVFLLLWTQRKQTGEFITARARRLKGDEEMYKIAQRYIGKDVLLNTVASGTYDGVIKEVVDNAVVLEKNGEQTVVNLDYVILLREYPRGKNGKRKSIVTD